MKRILVCLLAGLALLAPPVLAQTVGESIGRVQQSKPKDEKPLPGTTGTEAPTAPVVPPTGGSLAVTSVRVTGSTFYAPDVLDRDVVSKCPGVTGPNVSFERLDDCARAVQRYYREQGYLFTRAVVVPERAGGIAEIKVTEAFIDDVTVEEPNGPIGPVKDLIARFAGQLKGLRNPRISDLERQLLMINDIPGIRATAVPHRGKGGEGAVSIAVNATRAPFEGGIFADNKGSPVLGRLNLAARGALDSQTSLGERAELILFSTGEITNARSRDFRERQAVQFMFDTDMSADGLRGRLTAQFGKTRPGDYLEVLDIKGSASMVRAEVKYPLLRSRPLSLWLGGGFDRLNSDIDVSGGLARLSNDKLRVFFASGEVLQRDIDGFTKGTFEFRHGFRMLGASRAGDPGLSRADGSPRFIVLKADVTREQQLSWIMDGLYASARVSGQISDHGLLGVEEMSLGGTTVGRGYDPSEATGDSGLGLSVEAKYRTTVSGWNIPMEAYVFSEWGRVWNRGAAEPKGSEVASVGLGARFLVDEKFGVGLEVAKPVGPELNRTRARDPNVFVTLGYTF